LEEAQRAPASETEAGRSAPRPKVSHGSVLFGLALLAVILTGVAATIYVRRPAPVVTRLDVVTPPTTEPFSFALSPDGRALVFVANGDTGSQLWLRRLDQATADPLEGTSGATYPFWSPDSEAIAFFADPVRSGIYLGSLDGGTPRQLLAADTAAVFAPPDQLLMLRGGALVATRFDSVSASTGVEFTSVAQSVGSEGGSFNRGAVSV